MALSPITLSRVPRRLPPSLGEWCRQVSATIATDMRLIWVWPAHYPGFQPQLRAAGIATLNTWCTETTFLPFVDKELLCTALNTENPNLRAELLGWLEEKLPTTGKLPAEIQTIIVPFFGCLEDRSAEVRKKAQTFLPVLAAKVGYDTLLKQTTRQVESLLKSIRVANVPSQAETREKPAQQDKPVQPEKQDPPTKPDSGEGAGVKKGAKSTKDKTTVKSKKDGEEAAGPPIVFVPNGKEQRIKDEEKMKGVPE
eukprot:Em0018g4a